MATYAIGDIHGCFEPLCRLLELISFDPRRDHIWLTGDVVNRGPQSLASLRWARGLGKSVTYVLGNHELHLLGRAAGVRAPKPRDTLDEILSAPDADELCDFVASRPLLHREADTVLVHAGLHPSWSIEDAEARARELEAGLRSADRRAFLHKVLAPAAAEPHPTSLHGALATLTRLRICTTDGAMHLDFTGTPDEIPKGHVPWFRANGRRSTARRVLFGHWAALGFYRGENVVGLDSGCVWGRTLTALRLDDDNVFSVPARR